MSAAIRLPLFLLPLLAFMLWGTTYKPGMVFSDEPYDTDISSATLPPLPGWAKAPLPDFSTISDTIEKKAAFFSYLYPRIVLVNTRILIQRQYLFDLADKQDFNSDEIDWLEQHASRLRITAPLGSDEMFDQLSLKLDIIPPSLILAQAANESAWGTSRFAVSGNNLFGQWCFSQGCGLVPASRVEGANHEVARFTSPYQSIRSYAQNLNRHPTYRPLRAIRNQTRSNNETLEGIAMAAGLMGYSERGEDYVKEIRSMIRFNNLAYYDRHFNESIVSQSDNEALMTISPEQTLLPGQPDAG